MKRDISRAFGIPVSRSGRQRKLGAAMGCTTLAMAGLLVISLLLIS